MSGDLLERHYNEPGQPNPYDLVEKLTHPGGRELDREQLLLELAQFTEANSALAAQFDQLAGDLIRYTGHPDSFEAHPIDLSSPISLNGENKYPGDRYSPHLGIELLLNQSVTAQTGGEHLLRSVYGGYYKPPVFLGSEKPAQNFWALGLADLSDESDYTDFRPPFMIAISIDCTQAAIIPRLSDEAIEDKLDDMRAYKLSDIGRTAGNHADTAAYLALLTEVRCVLTDPNLSRAAYRALTIELGLRALISVTAPEFKSVNNIHSRIDTRTLHQAIGIANADRMPIDL